MVILLQIKLKYACDIFSPRHHFKKQMCSSWAFHVDECSESPSKFDMNIFDELRSPWGIRHNHELQ
jgi:hypothetical protein